MRSIRVRGYLLVSYILGFRIMCRGIIRYMPRSVELPPRGAVDDDNDMTRALMITILPVYMSVVQPVTIRCGLPPVCGFYGAVSDRTILTHLVCIWYLVYEYFIFSP